MTAVSAQRKYKRVRYHISVGCLGPFEVFEAKTENLSEDGGCLQLSREISEGFLLPLIFRLPTRWKPVVACARVMWSRRDEVTGQFNCGIQYIWLSPEDREMLADFLGFFKDENEESSLISFMLAKGEGTS